MEQSPHLSRTFHLRMVTMLSFFWIVDLLFTAFACESILLEGPSVMILFASEVRELRPISSLVLMFLPSTSS